MTETLLLQLSALALETASALENGGVPSLVLKTFEDAALPIWIQIGIAAKTANTPLAATLNQAPVAAGVIPGVINAPGGIVPPVALKSPSAGTPAPAPAQNKAVVSHTVSTVETPDPIRRRKTAGM